MRWDYGILLSVICLAATIGVVGAASLSDAISTGKTVADVSQIKAIEISKNTSVIGMVSKPTAAGGITVNIEKIWTDKSGRLCVKYTASDKGGERAVINPTCIYNPPIMVQTGSFFTEDPKAALVSVLVRNAATRPYGKARGGDGDPTFISYATYDRQLRRNITTGTTFSDLVTGSGVISSSEASPAIGYLTGTVAAGNYTNVWRYGVTFNTTPILSNSTVTSASVSTFGSAKWSNSTDALMLVSFSPSNKLSYTASDYNIANWGNTPLAPNISYSSISTTAYNNYTLSDSSYITKEGYTAIGIRSAADVNQIPYPWSSGQYRSYNVRGVTTAGTTQDPFITIDYTEADITPPGSITGLTNSTPICNSANVNWTNPVDADLGIIGVLINGTWNNQTNSTTSIAFAGLPESTAMRLNFTTVDLSGNQNLTHWQNISFTTLACGVTPVAAFSANNVSVCQGTDTQFTDESTNTPTTWYWEFGDGNTSTTQNPLKTYDVTGLMNVNLKAANAYGSDWENKTAYINVTDCVVPTPTPTPTPAPAFKSNFVSNVTCGNVPFFVAFNDTSTGLNITYWSWDFGDGNTSTSQNNITQYSSPGLYTVRHSINDGLGNISWDNRTGYIRAVPDWITCAAASGAGGGGGSTGGEAVGAAFGIIGGILGAIIIFRRRGEMQ